MKRLWQGWPGGSKNSRPVPFGYKTGWITVRCASSERVASATGIRSTRSATWQKGIDAAYNRGLLFVTPPVNEWVCIVGESTLGNPSIDAISKQVAGLSYTFGEAQGFGSHRVIEYHHWMLAKGGSLIRSFAQANSGSFRGLRNNGTQTKVT
jgi:hypothetical protein